MSTLPPLRIATARVVASFVTASSCSVVTHRGSKRGEGLGHVLADTAPRTIKLSESTYEEGCVWEEPSLVVMWSGWDGKMDTSSKSLKFWKTGGAEDMGE